MNRTGSGLLHCRRRLRQHLSHLCRRKLQINSAAFFRVPEGRVESVHPVILRGFEQVILHHGCPEPELEALGFLPSQGEALRPVPKIFTLLRAEIARVILTQFRIFEHRKKAVRQRASARDRRPVFAWRQHQWIHPVQVVLGLPCDKGIDEGRELNAQARAHRKDNPVRPKFLEGYAAESSRQSAFCKTTGTTPSAIRACQ